MYTGAPIRLSAEFSEEISEARREQHNIFKILRGEEEEEKKKTSKEKYSIQQGYYPKEFITTKVNLTINVKGTCLSRKDHNQK